MHEDDDDAPALGRERAEKLRCRRRRRAHVDEHRVRREHAEEIDRLLRVARHRDRVARLGEADLGLEEGLDVFGERQHATRAARHRLEDGSGFGSRRGIDEAADGAEDAAAIVRVGGVGDERRTGGRRGREIVEPRRERREKIRDHQAPPRRRRQRGAERGVNQLPARSVGLENVVAVALHDLDRRRARDRRRRGLVGRCRARRRGRGGLERLRAYVVRAGRTVPGNRRRGVRWRRDRQRGAGASRSLGCVASLRCGKHRAQRLRLLEHRPAFGIEARNLGAALGERPLVRRRELGQLAAVRAGDLLHEPAVLADGLLDRTRVRRTQCLELPAMLRFHGAPLAPTLRFDHFPFARVLRVGELAVALTLRLRGLALTTILRLGCVALGANDREPFLRRARFRGGAAPELRTLCGVGLELSFDPREPLAQRANHRRRLGTLVVDRREHAGAVFAQAQGLGLNDGELGRELLRAALALDARRLLACTFLTQRCELRRALGIGGDERLDARLQRITLGRERRAGLADARQLGGRRSGDLLDARARRPDVRQRVVAVAQRRLALGHDRAQRADTGERRVAVALEMPDRRTPLRVDPLGGVARRGDLLAVRCRIGLTLAPLLRDRRLELASRGRLRLFERGAVLRACLGELAPHERDPMLRLFGVGGGARRRLRTLLVDSANLRLERRHALAQRLDDGGRLRAGIVDDRENALAVFLETRDLGTRGAELRNLLLELALQRGGALVAGDDVLLERRHAPRGIETGALGSVALVGEPRALREDVASGRLEAREGRALANRRRRRRLLALGERPRQASLEIVALGRQPLDFVAPRVALRRRARQLLGVRAPQRRERRLVLRVAIGADALLLPDRRRESTLAAHAQVVEAAGVGGAHLGDAALVRAAELVDLAVLRRELLRQLLRLRGGATRHLGALRRVRRDLALERRDLLVQRANHQRRLGTGLVDGGDDARPFLAQPTDLGAQLGGLVAEPARVGERGVASRARLGVRTAQVVALARGRVDSAPQLPHEPAGLGRRNSRVVALVGQRRARPFVLGTDRGQRPLAIGDGRVARRRRRPQLCLVGRAQRPELRFMRRLGGAQRRLDMIARGLHLALARGEHVAHLVDLVLGALLLRRKGAAALRVGVGDESHAVRGRALDRGVCRRQPALGLGEPGGERVTRRLLAAALRLETRRELARIDPRLAGDRAFGRRRRRHVGGAVRDARARPRAGADVAVERERERIEREHVREDLALPDRAAIGDREQHADGQRTAVERNRGEIRRTRDDLARDELGDERVVVRPLDDVRLAIHEPVERDLPRVGGAAAELLEVTQSGRREAARADQLQCLGFGVIEEERACRRVERVEEQRRDRVRERIERHLTDLQLGDALDEAHRAGTRRGRTARRRRRGRRRRGFRRARHPRGAFRGGLHR